MQDFLHYAQKVCTEMVIQAYIHNSTDNYTGKK